MNTAIVWFRRDLRITDNTALRAAVERAATIVPVFVLSTWKGNHRWTGANRQQFLCGCLSSLAQNLAAVGGRLVIRSGKAVEELAKLALETGARAIFFNRDPDPFGRRVEADLAAFGQQAGIDVVGCKDATIHDRDEVLTSSSEPFRVFTPYVRAWAKAGTVEAKGRIRRLKTPDGLASLPLPTLETWGLKPEADVLKAGEKAARSRMKRFLDRGLADYGTSRNALDQELTSRLSQDLRFGLLSIRELLGKCQECASGLPAAGKESAEKFISELIWREFYFEHSLAFPRGA